MFDARHLPGEHDQQTHGHGGGGGGGGGFAGGKASGVWKSLKSKTESEAIAKHDVLWKASGGNRVKSDWVAAIRDYTESTPVGYYNINKLLRTGKLPKKIDEDDEGTVLGNIATMDRAFDNASLAKNTLTYRTVKPNVFAKIVKAVGGEFIDKAFVSTTADKEYAKRFSSQTLGVAAAHILPIIIRAGARALPLASVSAAPYEEEVLIDRSAKFKVKQSSKGRIFLELVSHVAKESFDDYLFDDDAFTKKKFFETLNANRRDFDPGQPRDEDGQWTGSGGGGSGGGSSTANLRPAPDRADWPDHIKKLKLPPAWTNVKISDDPKSALQVVGRDAKGRPQYVYSAEFQATQQGFKFARVLELTKKLDVVRQQNNENMKSHNATMREHAECMSLVMEMGLRPGSSADTKAAQQAYGATTLEGRHVIEEAGRVALRFVGKKGVSLDLPVEGRELRSMLLRKAKEAGPDGSLFPRVNERSLLDYSDRLDGGGFKTKDFRTALATTMASNLVATMSRPENVKRFKTLALEVAKVVSRKLGNTPTIALQSYIHPTVFAPWRDNAES